MAHPRQTEYSGSVHAHGPAHFDGASVLAVGWPDIDGAVRDLFEGEGRDDNGVDLQPGPGLGLACPDHLLALPTASFEHNPLRREAPAHVVRVTRPGGLIRVSCATTGRKEHGTSRTNPDASPFTVQEKWDYYRNLTGRDLERGVNLGGWLSDLHSWVHYINCDLYFAGLRHGGVGRLDVAMVKALDARYAMNASAKTLRRGLKIKLLGDRQSR